jgi:hypothetical protein
MSDSARPAGPVFGERSLEQDLFAPFDGLCGIEIIGASYRRPRAGPVRFDLLDNRRRLVRSVVLDGLEDNRPQAVLWHPLAESRGRRFRLRITAPSLERQSPVTAWIEVPDPDEHFRLTCRLHGALLDGGLRRRLLYSWAGKPPRAFDRRGFEARVQSLMVEATVSEKLLRERQQKLGLWMRSTPFPLASGDRVLEIGAGLGDLSHELAAKASSWIGFEPCASIRRVLAHRMRHFPHATVCPQGRLTTLPDGPFDLVVWHAPTLREPAPQIMRLLRTLPERLAPTGLLWVDDLDQADAVAWSRYVPLETREEYTPLRPTVEDPLKRRLLRQLECAGFLLERVEWSSHRLSIRAIPRR